MKKSLKNFFGIFIILFFCIINISESSKAMKVDINSPVLTCLDSKSKKEQINELRVLKEMFKDLKLYIIEPKNLNYKSRSCSLNLGIEFKHKFDNISRLNSYSDDEVFIQVHNYIRFLHIFFNDIIIPIHSEIYKSDLIHDKTYSIINETLKNVLDLINIIEAKYSESISYIDGIGNFTVIGDNHHTYSLYIDSIYRQLKSLENLLKPYRFKTIYFIKSEFA